MRKEPLEHPDCPTPALETSRETSEEQTKARRACGENTQRVIPYACFFGAYRSAIVVPLAARIGEPKHQHTIVVANTVGIWSKIKVASVRM